MIMIINSLTMVIDPLMTIAGGKLKGFQLFMSFPGEYAPFVAWLSICSSHSCLFVSRFPCIILFSLCNLASCLIFLSFCLVLVLWWSVTLCATLQSSCHVKPWSLAAGKQCESIHKIFGEIKGLRKHERRMYRSWLEECGSAWLLDFLSWVILPRCWLQLCELLRICILTHITVIAYTALYPYYIILYCIKWSTIQMNQPAIWVY